MTLPAVSPPTDWTGVIVVVAIVVALAVAFGFGYLMHARRTPGKQFGEEELERLIGAAISKTMASGGGSADATVTVITFDGLTFRDEADLAKYKDAKATLDAFKGGTK